MKKLLMVFLGIAVFSPFPAIAQQGIHGALNVTTGTVIVNEYSIITANLPAGSTTIPVASSSLNANSRFASPLQPGDLIMIYQAQGTIIKDIGAAPNPDTTWGKVVNEAVDYYGTGRYEFHQVVSVPNATSIVVDCGTTYDYYANAGTARKPFVIRVPRYTSVSITGGTLTCDDWNGSTGGVLAIEVQGNVTVTSPGTIDATGKGFRGGSLVGDNATTFGSNTNTSTDPMLGAEKGEGVAGYQAEYDPFGGRYCRAPGANGGGGGDAHNAGGGGGANAPNSTSATAYWSGLGIPDPNAAYTAAWNIEPPVNTMSLRTAANSSGGGRGGYTFSGSNQNAGTLPPGNATWGGDARNYQACGLGGRPLDYSTGRLFLGGGGGAGDQNNSGGGNGGDGGGLIFLTVFGNISGNGTIQSNGLNGANGQGGSGVITGIDAGGGGGAGGTIVLKAVGGVANTLTVNANGGNGGNQVINLPGATSEGEGPGGGGGGGYIAVSSGSPTRNCNGGNNGTTNSSALTEFPPNGATRGCPGTNNATISWFDINLTNITICSGNSVTLTATITGTLPPGTVINWYTASVGGSPIATGSTYNTGPLAATTTYWVGTCPGYWREPVTVTVGPAPTVSISPSATTVCSGTPTTLTASGATTYTWMPGSLSGTSVSVTPATTTTYTVTGSTGPGCSSTATATVTVNPTPTVTATASSATICSGGSSTLTGSGATTYTWNPGNISGSPITVSPTTTTTYTVTGTSSGCSGTAQVTVTVNPSPTVTATAAIPTICNSGSTTLTGTGATSYTWMPGSLSGSTVTVSPTTTTTYTVTGTGANSCTNTAQVTVTVNPSPTVTATASSSTICSGSSTTLTGSGATTYTWNPGNISGSPITVSPASTTTYTVSGTSGGCSSTAQVTVTVNPSPTVTATAANATICNGGSTTLTGSGATSYDWMPGSLSGTTVTVSPTSTTTYTVTGTGANSCTNTAQVTVTVNPTPTVTATAANPIICVGGSTTLTGTGANTYTWMPGSMSGSSVSVSPAATTTYTVTGFAANGCSNSAQVTVTVNPTPTVTATAANAAICSGGSTTLTGSGATTYTWMPGSLSGTTVTVSPASTTTYTVTGSNGGCSNTAQVTVTVNPLPTVSAAAANASICSGSSTTLTGSGATTYSWMPGSLSGSPVTVTPSATTTYTVTGTDGNNCSSSAQVTVTVNPLPAVTAAAANPSICSGSSTTLTGSGATNYSWMPGSLSGSPVTVTPSATTTYTVTGTDGNSCSNTAQVTVTVNPLPTPLATAAPDSICIGQSAGLSASGGATYTWNGGSLVNASGASQTVTPSVTTTYSVDVTDANSCSASTQVTVTVNPLPVPTATAASDSICAGQPVSLSATGGTTYSWNGGSLVNAAGASQTDTPPVATTYTVDVTDANGCTASAQVSITVNALPVANAGADQSVCSGTPVTLSATGGTTYSWNGGTLSNAGGQTQTDTPGATTPYIVTVTDVNGCSQNDTMLVTVNATPAVSAGSDVSICPSSSIQLNATGAVSYVWTPSAGLDNDTIASPNASPAATSTYVVTGTAANGCSSSDTIVVSIGNNLTVFAGSDLTICAGDTIQLSTSGGVTYNWTPSATLGSPNSAVTDAFPSATTTYVVQVTDAANCQGSDTVTVFVNGPVALTAGGGGTICIGQTATLTATPSNGTGPYAYNWSDSLSGPGPQIVSPATSTTYSVSVTDSLGCSSPVQTITVNVNPPVTAAALTNPTLCQGDTTSIVAGATGGDGNFTYSWMPGSLSGDTVTISPAVTTTYTLIVTDGCGSPPDTVTSLVTVTAAPVVTVASNITSGCGPLCVDFTGSSTGNCVSSAWAFGDGNTSTTQNPTNCYQNSGSYDVTYTCTDANGCSGSVTMNGLVTVLPSPVASFSTGVVANTVTIVPGSPVQVCFVDNSTNAASWDWSFITSTSTQQSPCFAISDTGYFCAQLVVANAGGCTDTTFECIRAISEATYTIPNVFTPNADGTNDAFMITSAGVRDFHCEIYDRWGVLVYRWDSASAGWDGHTTSGMLASDGVYYYVMRITDYSDKSKEEKGFVHLVRGGR